MRGFLTTIVAILTTLSIWILFAFAAAASFVGPGA